MAEVKGAFVSVRFQDFELDLHSGELRQEGVPNVRLPHQSFQILKMLLECSGKVVSRAEIQQRLWPDGTIVEFEHSIGAAMNRLRQVLGDSAENPRFIETFTRRGYRWMGGAEWVAESEPRSPSAIDSLAVLPFVNSSGDPDTEYLSDGIAESLINNLAQLHGLRVTARNTAFRYKGKDLDLQKIGKDLVVSAIVAGRLLQRGDNLIVQTELVETQKGSHLWGQQYKLKLSDVLALQEDISRQISENLRLHLTGEEKQQLARHCTQNAEAYQLYLKGQFYWNKRTGQSLRKAVESYQQAIEKDPSFALAYAGLADSYSISTILGSSPPDVMAKAKAAARRAVQLDPNSGESNTALALIRFFYDWDWDSADQYFRRAITLSPSYPTAHYWYGISLCIVGRSEEGLREAKRALELDPLSLPANFALGLVSYYALRHDEAIEAWYKTLELDPNFSLGHWGLGRAYVGKGMFEEARSEFQKYSDLSPGSLPSSALGYCFGRISKRAQALRILEELKALSHKEFVSPISFALVYVGLGDKDQSFAALEQAIQERAPIPAWVRDAFWDPINSDPRYAELLRRMNLPE